MTPHHSIITQDEYDALKITLAARDAKIKEMRKGLQEIYLGVARPRDIAMRLLSPKGPY